jgi:ribosome-binding factor A
MSSGYRRERIAEVVRSFLGSELPRLNDPRLHNITLTDVEMSPDLKFAKVFWTIHSTNAAPGEETDPKAIDQGKQALQGVSALLRRRIGEELELRYLPALQFRFDESIDRGMRIDYLLAKVHQ